MLKPVALSPGHLPQALALSQALQWPYRLEDWAFAVALGRGFAVEIDARLAGTALWWPYGQDHASAGMIIVAADAQRMGIGRALMEALLADAAGRSMILNSTREGFSLYGSLGFVERGHVRQHQAVLTQAPAPGPGSTARPFRPTDLEAIRRLDRAASGMERTTLIDALFGIGEVMVLERDGAVCGYGCARRWGRGVVIGPVVAETGAAARGIISALAAPHAGQFVRVDVTSGSGLSPWLEAIGLPQVDQVVAMTRGEPPRPSGLATLFALANQSLG
ncbi:MAG TPA: GNAT family N-acetyltransferase [Phenylobacterium sp.]|nr:GNAT family N-acetyltransferase [Phenylobacterium sp.]